MTRRTPWSQAVTALGALAVTALITSCAGPSTPSPTMADEQRADTVTVPAGTWTPTPIDVLTEIPPEAAQRTPAGAEAYVRYYFDTLNHLSMNPQTGQITKLCLPDVLACTNPEVAVADMATSRTRFRDPVYEVIAVQGVAIDPDNLTGVLVTAQTTARPRAVLNTDLSTYTSFPAQGPDYSEFTVVWQQGRWLIRQQVEDLTRAPATRR